MTHEFLHLLSKNAQSVGVAFRPSREHEDHPNLLLKFYRLDGRWVVSSSDVPDRVVAGERRNLGNIVPAGAFLKSIVATLAGSLSYREFRDQVEAAARRERPDLVFDWLPADGLVDTLPPSAPRPSRPSEPTPHT